MAATDPRALAGWDREWDAEWYRTDFYALLGAHPKTATEKNIRDAQHRAHKEAQERRLAAQESGDAAAYSRLEDELKLVNKAAEVLRNVRTRAQYDRYLAWHSERQAAQQRVRQLPADHPRSGPPPSMPSPPPRQPPRPPERATEGIPFHDLGMFPPTHVTQPVVLTFAQWRDRFELRHNGTLLRCRPCQPDLTYVFRGLGHPGVLGPPGDLILRAVVTDPPQGPDHDVTLRPTRQQRKDGYTVQAPAGLVVSVEPGLRPGQYTYRGCGAPGPLGDPRGDLHLTIKRAKSGARLVWVLLLLILVGAGAWYVWRTGQSPTDLIGSMQHQRP
ncbi:MAG TPA: hypothetical protein VFL94_09255 [Actinomycetales bacterium]|nr:hypothetical protein [Actinomycetales bacterium]